MPKEIGSRLTATKQSMWLSCDLCKAHNPTLPNDFRSRVCISVLTSLHSPSSPLLLLLHQYGFRPDLGNAGQAMCAYSGVNGVPCCAHDYLQNKVRDLHFYA